MSVRHVVDARQVHAIQQVLMDVRDTMSALGTDACDADDIQQLVDKAGAELERPLPNISTIGFYLNSIARSLRAEPRARTTVLELDAVMREAHVPTNWEP